MSRDKLDGRFMSVGNPVVANVESVLGVSYNSSCQYLKVDYGFTEWSSEGILLRLRVMESRSW
jgi:hypothetical protein